MESGDEIKSERQQVRKVLNGRGRKGRRVVPGVTDSLGWWENQIRACVQKKNTQAPRPKIVFCDPHLLSIIKAHFLWKTRNY